ncbi:mitochondrial import inner membrane translocase subunit TIM10 [Yarrowia lipolytica]|nr:mitochondrial import inner membrane translocase subunit TIM10 [Yarrowia lipolytica]KAE8171418.1 mitochondrial import inner membrane translocase subunit TIM10 [Yarrowia lipolytica]RMI98240.1 mitochondrial import inner membrane translocase subunit TIM10 [Yarrowia lipolytica]
MSFLGLGGQNPNGPSNPQKLLAAEAELDMVTDMFNRLVESCHEKCIKADYSSGDLNANEGLCLDRCVAKYFDVNTKVGEVIHAEAWKQRILHGPTLNVKYVHRIKVHEIVRLTMVYLAPWHFN